MFDIRKREKKPAYLPGFNVNLEKHTKFPFVLRPVSKSFFFLSIIVYHKHSLVEWRSKGRVKLENLSSASSSRVGLLFL